MSDTAHVWTCEGDSGPPRSQSRLCSVLEAQLVACILLPLYIYRMESQWGAIRCVSTCNNTIFVRWGIGLGLGLLWTEGQSVVNTSKLPLCSNHLGYLVEEGVVCVFF